MSRPVATRTVPGAGPGRELLVSELIGSAGTGVPVLLVSGLGGAWFDWRPVAEALRAALPGHRVVVMDRPGAGAAPRCDAGTVDLPTAADELALALDAAGIDRAVLVGHSMGAWYVEACARRRPDRVAGLVLLDGSLAPVPGARGRRRRRRDGTPRVRVPGMRGRLVAAAVTARVLDLGVLALGGWRRSGPVLRALLEGPGPSGRIVSRHRAAAREIYGRPGPWHAALREWAAYPHLRGQLAALRAGNPLPPVPVVDVTATRVLPAGLSPWAVRHRSMVRRLRDSEPATDPGVVVRSGSVAGAPHMLMLTHPDEVAARVAELVRAADA